MIDAPNENHPDILKQCESFVGNRAYDDIKLIKKLEEHEISPEIDIRNCWQSSPETTKALEKDMRITHTFDGEFFCSKQTSDKEKRMVCRAFEKNRNAKKYDSPAKHYGLT